ncbi:MAG: transglutaminase domain-containing protein [Planctomycetes bacterium]|nr:transglutaminase domain-containing protein [Planctomycetota bacterium]
MAVRTIKNRMPLREAYEAGQLARNVQMTPGSRSLVLYDTTLIEDDGPGARSLSLAWPTTWETVAGCRQARKLLYIDRLQTVAATLVFSGNPTRGEELPLVIRVNGHAITYRWPHGEGEVGGWQHVAVPPRWLRRGRNEIVFSCEGPGGWWLSIAPRSEIVLNEPGRKSVAGTRSQLSLDHGRMWGKGLGPDGEQAGEYMVRLNLRQYRKQGELIGPVIDLAAAGANEGDAVVAAAVKVRSLSVRATAKKPAGTSVRLDVRTGSSPLYDARYWGPWRACKGGRATPSHANHRFAQWRVTLATNKASVTPQVTAVGLDARVETLRPEWARGIRVTDSHNEAIRCTSIPFEYERFDVAQLKSLRRKYKLERVIAGAKDELEAIRRLRDWVARQWDWAPPGQPYPMWDAHDILGRKDGMCVHFAIALMQCALAVGLQARFTFGWFLRATLGGKHQGGHEVTEVWSNQFGKWVYMDATSTRNECYVDRRTGIPLSMLEMHDETVRLYLGKRAASLDGISVKAEKRSPRLRVWSKDDAEPAPGPAPIRLRWGAVHWMPRNNFYARRRPEPIVQGRIDWAWPGYWLWWDAQTPRQPWFGNYTCRRSDIEWTINQVRFAAEYAAEPGTVSMHLSTVTPDFETFLVSVDGGPWTAAGETVQWQLGPGINRIEMRVRTRAGVLGNTSWLELDCGQ